MMEKQRRQTNHIKNSRKDMIKMVHNADLFMFSLHARDRLRKVKHLISAE